MSLHACLDCASNQLIFHYIFLSFFFSFKLDPYSVSHLRCEYHSGGYGLAVIWDTPYGVVDRVQVDVDRKSFNKSYSSEKQIRLEINGLQAAKKYTVTATSFSGSRRSQTVSVNCETDPAGKIMSTYV